ncbi:histidine kinase [Paraburkholderia sp. SARCC-3016]|uniref:histidine kinase n=1 Tax=Paraburkholderia sp. SARCC-3016 TaxID=3058611 RepID=UPI0028086EBD|nr:histidine kinase [Paraburkholderia sp. SARCC-3016]MDQ7981719.1 histidine kinase [Paraburkholderia sp. SARCC-3016]
MQGTYNLSLVLLSLVIATLASYAALDLSAFISLLDKPKLRRAWLAGGATAMGTGIWSMHFVGMLAFSLPIPLGYDLATTGASLLIAIFASYFGLSVVTRQRLSLVRLLLGGTLMGTGIAGMHYAGMAAMMMEPSIRYDPTLLVASFTIAFCASTAALWLAHTLSMQDKRHVAARRAGAALVMGLAITGMHYTGMAAADFLPGSICRAASGIDTQWLATTVTLFTLAILLVTLMLSRFDARTTFLRGMADTLEEKVRQRTADLESALDRYQQSMRTLQRTREQMAREIDDRKAAQIRLEQEKDEQRRLLTELEQTHVQLFQSEHLASIGQLAAGVAHEINNPLAFVSANLNTLRDWVQRLLTHIAAYEAAVYQLESHTRAALQAARKTTELDYICGEVMTVIDESIDGAQRVRRIVQDLRDFSRPGDDSWSLADLHAGLDSTLNIVQNEIRYKAEIVKKYGDLPLIECVPSQMNQVFVSLLMNAAQAIEGRGVITICTVCEDDMVAVAISDTGIGMQPDVIRKAFDPFFTTRAVGQGTGLGLSVSHGIIERHHGTIGIQSEPGCGSTFTVRVPIRQRRVKDDMPEDIVEPVSLGTAR